MFHKSRFLILVIFLFHQPGGFSLLPEKNSFLAPKSIVNGFLNREVLPPLKKDALKVVMVSPEAAPFSKVGGLGDYMEWLPAALRRDGQETVVVTPLYANAKRADLIRKFNIQPLTRLLIPVGKESVSVEVMTCQIRGITYYLLVNDIYFDDLYKDVDQPEAGIKKAVVLSRGALELVKALQLSPEILHTNDWMAALVPTLLRTDDRYRHDPVFHRAKTVHTLHNLGWGYQGSFPSSLFPLLNLSGEHWFGLRFFKGDFWYLHPKRIGDPALYELWRSDDNSDIWELNLTAGAIGHHADRIVTVSPTFLLETLDHGKAHGLEILLQKRVERGEYFGIINGTNSHQMKQLLEKVGGKERAKQALLGDETALREYTDQVLPIAENSNSEDRRKILEEREKIVATFKNKIKTSGPILGMITRITDQKGIDLVVEKMESLLRENEDLIFIIQGAPGLSQINKEWAASFEKISQEFPGQALILIDRDMNFHIADLIHMGADMFLMPSKFEPGGIAQLIAMAVGTIPIVRSTGGLADTVADYLEEGGVGFRFDSYHPEPMALALRQAMFAYSGTQEKLNTLIKYTMAAILKYKGENIAEEMALVIGKMFVYLANNQKKWNTLVRSAMAAAQKYNWQNTAAEYLQVYKKIITPRGPRTFAFRSLDAYRVQILFDLAI